MLDAHDLIFMSWRRADKLLYIERGMREYFVADFAILLVRGFATGVGISALVLQIAVLVRSGPTQYDHVHPET